MELLNKTSIKDINNRSSKTSFALITLGDVIWCFDFRCLFYLFVIFFVNASFQCWLCVL